MPRAIVTARITQEQYSRINQLVNGGIFVSRSAVIQAFVELGLEHCNLGKDTWITKRVSSQLRTRAQGVTKRAAVHSLVKSIIEELSSLIEMQDCPGIINSLTLAKNAATQLPSDIEDQFMKALGGKNIFKVACQMIGGNPLTAIEKNETEGDEEDGHDWYY